MRKRGSSKKGIRNIFLLGGSSFFNDVGSEMITPVLPFYITGLGGGGVALGLVSGLKEGLSSLLKLLGGWLSDRTGKRNIFVFFGYLISTIFKFLLSLANSWQYIIAFISFERFGKLRDAPRDALIAQSTKKVGKGFGIQQMMDTAGAIVGTIFVIFLFWKLQLEINRIILIAAIISVFSLAPLIFVREFKTRKIKRSIFKSIHRLSPKLKYFIFVASVFGLVNFGLYLFIILRVKEITGSVLIPLILYAGFNFIYAFFAVPFGALSDRIGRKKVLLVGYILFFLIAVGFVYLQNFLAIGILFITYGLVYAITQSNQKALVSDLCGGMKATALGLYNSIIGIVSIIGGVIAGFLWDISYSTMFIYISVVTLVSIAFLIFVKEK